MDIYYRECEHGVDMQAYCFACDLLNKQPTQIISPNEARKLMGENYSKGSDVSAIVSPDAPTTENEKGGKQSHIPVRFDLIDGKALFAMAAVLHEGAEKYGANNWRKIDIEDHLNHLIMHAYAYLSGDRTDDHLSHIMCRAMFAQAVEITNEEKS